MANVTTTNFLTQAQQCTAPPDPAIDNLHQALQHTMISILNRPITAQDHPMLNDIAAACYHILGPIVRGTSRGLSNWVRGDIWAIRAEAAACFPGVPALAEARDYYTSARVCYEMGVFQRPIYPDTAADAQERLDRLKARWLLGSRSWSEPL